MLWIDGESSSWNSNHKSLIILVLIWLQELHWNGMEISKGFNSAVGKSFVNGLRAGQEIEWKCKFDWGIILVRAKIKVGSRMSWSRQQRMNMENWSKSLGWIRVNYDEFGLIATQVRFLRGNRRLDHLRNLKQNHKQPSKKASGKDEYKKGKQYAKDKNQWKIYKMTVEKEKWRGERRNKCFKRQMMNESICSRSKEKVHQRENQWGTEKL